MSTPTNLPEGASITTIGGKQCTAVPKSVAQALAAVAGTGQPPSAAVLTTSSSTSTLSSFSSLTSTSTSISSASLQTTSQRVQPPPAVVPQEKTLPPPVLESTTSMPSSTSIPQTTTQALSTMLPPALPALTTTEAITTSTLPPSAQTADLLSSSSAVTNTVALPASTPLPTQPDQQTDASLAPIPPSTSASITDPTTVPIALPESTTTPITVPGSTTTSSVDTTSVGSAALFTTIGIANPPTSTEVSGTNTTAATQVGTVADNNNTTNTQRTVAVAGGVIGGVVAIFLIAFLIWLSRKKLLKKRRSTLLTPLTPEPGFGISEKGPYSISRNSIGPTPIIVKFRDAVGQNIKKIRGRFGNSSSPSVNLNRGNSQFMEVSTHSRQNSSVVGATSGTLSKKDRIRNWWSRFSEDAKFNWRLRRAPKRSNTDPFVGTRVMKDTSAAVGSQPDFLTLLNMDEKQLESQANKSRNSINGKRRSTSAGPGDHFLAGLNFDSANPFSDANSMPHDSAKIPPLAVAGQSNPFSDTNAIQQATASKTPGPTNYVQNIRRSRGQSTSGPPRPLSTNTNDVGGRMESMYRDSVGSVESFATRRNKFRSDPFDLDRPELLSSSSESKESYLSNVSDNTSVGNVPPAPGRAHTRQDSFTSKYSSVASLGDWSDPGPDVGPATKNDSPAPTGPRRSGASQGSVGKAL